MKIKLSTIISSLESTNEEITYFIDLLSGKIIQDSDFGSFYTDCTGEVDLEILENYLAL